MSKITSASGRGNAAEKGLKNISDYHDMQLGFGKSIRHYKEGLDRPFV